jgi:transposase
LTPRARLRLARLIVDHHWPPARAAERYDVSWRTAKKWADRYREEGPDGMLDRSSAPRRQPDRTSAPAVRKIVHLRSKQRLGPVEIATGSAWRPRPRTPCWSDAGSTGPPTSTAPLAS